MTAVGPRALLLAAAAVIAACASSEKPKPTPLEPLTAQIAGRQVWSARVDRIDFPLTIAVNNDVFMVAGRDGTVRALRATDGTEVWRGSAGALLTAGVGSDGRFAAVVTRDNELVVLEGGSVKWRARLASRVTTAPLVAGERVFVMGVDRAVQAFDALDGRRLWTLQRPGDPLTLLQRGVLAPFGDTLLAGQGSRLAGVDPLRGTVRWEVAVATPRGTNEVERLADLVGPAVRQGDRVCARAFQSAVGCVDALRGVLLWNRNTGGTEAVGGNAQIIVGADASSRVTAWKADSGEVAWTHERLLHRELSAPLVVGPTAVFGDVEGYVHFLSTVDGQTLLRLGTDGSAVVAPPVLAGTTILVATRAGGLFAFRPQ